MRRAQLLSACTALAALGAVACFAAVLTQIPSWRREARATVLIQQAQERAGQGLRTEARRLVEEAYALSPENAKVHRELGLQLLAEGDAARGAQELRTAADMTPADAGAAWEAGFALNMAGQTKDSIAYLQRVIAMERGNGVAYAMMANGLMRLGRMPEALRAARTGVELSPRVSLTSFTLGMVTWKMRDLPRAKEAMEQALLLRPADIATLLSLAAICGEMGRLDEAADSLARVALLQPNSPEVLATYGKVQLVRREYQRAEQAFARALQLDPNNATARAGWAKLHPQTPAGPRPPR